MRVSVLCLLVLLAVSCYSSPVPERSDYSADFQLFRARRTPQFVKGQKTTRAPIHLNLRKGEYICGNKICSLRPGEVPPNCGGVCQYKV
ncbi:uncharacterized protein [Choristoneura fumiferana]|uniref:uncharacterized protein n=1 Tax=Choristoneura fumiferana TaxID=7141 RepID=UPI003D15B4B3